MDHIIKLTHPAGKKAVSMDGRKYDLVKTPFLNCLKKKGDSTHKEILQAIVTDFENDETKFEGSIEWHMEWVKLDLEARKQIKRIRTKSPIKFAIRL